ncbi:hypothetical protein BRADI_1g46520v3 [Brachypodium distachyon]|uniref:G-protein coupled receptors family 2 profile 2 domain-containing protein n=1 Tax=Brachypodium distachyon TaxID=15368 RepID=A0A0Q3NNL1_BRADI|nr:hypothetical protein BRADI_1g46520v3 [Brachypodium distachyon]
MAAAAAAAASQSLRNRELLDAVGTTAAALSLAGSSFIVLCYLLFRELRKFSFKLVYFLALADMLCSLFSIMGGPANTFYCFAHDYSAHFFCVASFLWTTTIAFTLHRTVVKHKTDVEEFGFIFHLYVWGTSLATTVLRSIGSDNGRPGTWCWIQQGSTGKILHLVTFYLPLWGAILYNGFTYYQVNRMLNNATRMAVGISDRSIQSDMRADKKVHGLLQQSTVCMTLLIQATRYFGCPFLMSALLDLWAFLIPLLTGSTLQCAEQLQKELTRFYRRVLKGAFLLFQD